MPRVIQCVWIGLLSMVSLPAAEPVWQESSSGSQSSLRGVAVAMHSTAARPVVWASGSKGTILFTPDLGKTWGKVGPSKYPELEFRSLHAWDENRAIVASAGTPAIVLKTTDGGQSWREVHRDDRAAAFFDGLKFIDAQRGVLFGDPIDGRFVVLTTSDAGETWQPVPADALPAIREGEAAFAASNSAMIVASPGNIWIGTGGAKSDQARVLCSIDFGKSWQATLCPLHSGASTGIFSLATSSDQKTLVAVGGDYQPEARSDTTGAVSLDNGQSYRAPEQPPTGYRSSVVYTNGRFIATGPAGTDWSPDGMRWKNLSEVGFHALAVLPGNRIVAVGSNGRFGLLDLTKNETPH